MRVPSLWKPIGLSVGASKGVEGTEGTECTEGVDGDVFRETVGLSKWM